MANTTEPRSWAEIADEFDQFQNRYPRRDGQFPVALDYLSIGWNHGDRTSRWILNGSDESAIREFQDMAAYAWKKLSGLDHPHAWMRWCDVLLAEAAKNEVHSATLDGFDFPEPPPKRYRTFDLSDACRIAGRIARKLSRGSVVWQWPDEQEHSDATEDGSSPAEPPAAALPEPLPSPSPLQPNRFRRIGQSWEVSHQGHSAGIPPIEIDGVAVRHRVPGAAGQSRY